MASAAPAHTRCGVTVCIPSGTGFTFGMISLLAVDWTVLPNVPDRSTSMNRIGFFSFVDSGVRLQQPVVVRLDLNSTSVSEVVGTAYGACFLRRTKHDSDTLDCLVADLRLLPR